MKTALKERFFRYAAIASQSKGGAGVVPSSEGQRRLAELLREELSGLGMEEIQLSAFGVLTAKLPARVTKERAGLPSIGFVAHLDTVDVHLSPEVKPCMVQAYDGKDICLNEKEQIFLRVAEHPELQNYIGQDIITSDGTSVLGADNKAAISAIMTALDWLKAHPEYEHGPVYVAFVPDEEVGLAGAKHMDLSVFPVDFAYTIDCCALGEVVYETFNAGSAFIDIQGVSAHPMSAKGVLVNANLVATDFVQMFDRLETPENTEGKEGYIWVKQIHGNQSAARVVLDIRDHDKTRYEARKRYVKDAVAFLGARHPRASISCEIKDVYGNIADAIKAENRKCIDILYTAMHNLGIEPKTIAMRGGTDGSFLSTQGIPTPNFFTGAHNFHSNSEFMPMDSFEKSCRMILELLRLALADEQEIVNSPAR